MWQVVQRGDVQDYGMLEEFVTMVTEIVPELWSCSQRAQLLLGLRARLVLELCRTEQTLDLTNIQKHLDRIRSLTSTGEAESSDAEVELSESKFVELVESLLKDPSERENFYQDVFPVEFGPKYDTAIQMLMLEFLSRFEKLLPIPDLEQVIRMNNTCIKLAWEIRSQESICSCLRNCVLDMSMLLLMLLNHVPLSQDCLLVKCCSLCPGEMFTICT
uniref:Zinc finger protein 420-like n=1 Tax=Salmo trutta TaxID=8032 RepID=A0A674DTF6_SALTR